MESAGNSSDEPGKQASSSIRTVFNGLFSRDRFAQSATLTSYKVLSDGENNFPEGSKSTSSENQPQHQCEDDVAPSSATGQKAESLAEPDLVTVTRVETHSDSEDEEVAQSSPGSTRKPTLPEEESSNLDCSDGDELKDGSEAEYHVPVFRTHRFREAPVLISRTDSGSLLVSPASKQEDDCSPEKSTAAMSEKNSENKGIDDDEYTGIDCSMPEPSIITRPLASEETPCKTDTPTEQTEEKQEQRSEAQDGTEKLDPTQDVSSVLSNSETPEVPAETSSSPEKQPGSAALTEQATPQSSVSVESKNDVQVSGSPASQCEAPPKTPQASTPPAAPSSASSSPSKSTPLSSPPSFQMPALFSGLRVLKKGAVGEDRETMSQIKQSEKDTDLALLSLKKSVNKAKMFPEQMTTSPTKKHTEPKPVADTKSIVMEQLSHVFRLETNEGTKKSSDGQEADAGSRKESSNGEQGVREKTADPETPTSTPEKKKSTDLAYETFKSLFGPKSAKKDKAEEVDLEAVKRKIKSDKESLRSIFERTKSPSKEQKSPTETQV